MPLKREKYVPKHRQDAALRVAAQAPRKVLRNTVVMSSVAVAATGGVVATGVTGTSVAVSTAAQDLDSVAPQASGSREVVERSAPISRSDRRDAADPAKEAALSQEDGPAVTRTEDLSDDDPRSVARALLPQFGFAADQFGCLDALWVSESDWRIDADNPTSSAYGIPQALTELHDLPADYMTSAEAQIRWGLGYIQDSYGSPCSAWSFKQANNWY
jgi:hypothetical protein